ncbi:MAG: helix-turn-helix transcriptional regulator [Lachnospiraceae bacterium]|nr:helix-turn-helix transcriptional regulator [Lachnospiraceae bacterium]MBP5254329.1 helix-turn-helix transcriptional regulator [Lachnospiraceae bacterium]
MEYGKHRRRLNSLVVGEVIAEARRDRNLSQEDLGNRIGMARTMLSAIERGSRNPNLETFCRICSGMEIPASDLLRTIEGRIGQYGPQGPLT